MWQRTLVNSEQFLRINGSSLPWLNPDVEEHMHMFKKMLKENTFSIEQCCQLWYAMREQVFRQLSFA